MNKDTPTETIWVMEIDQCPHCNTKLELESRSFISEKTAIHYLYKELYKHLDTCKPTKRRIVTISSRTEKYYQYGKYSSLSPTKTKLLI
jgi:uncharacterized protein with PIN domain